MIRLVIWDLGDTLVAPPAGGQDEKPLYEYAEVVLRDNAMNVLRRLNEQGYEQAVLSNTAVTDSAGTRRLLENLGVDAYFKVVHATASELDPSLPGKPDGVVFRRLLEEARTAASEAVMVGNSWDTDVLGANRSRIHAIWLQNTEVCVRRDQSAPISTPPFVLPVWDILQVEEALALLSSLKSP